MEQGSSRYAQLEPSNGIRSPSAHAAAGPRHELVPLGASGLDARLNPTCRIRRLSGRSLGDERADATKPIAAWPPSSRPPAIFFDAHGSSRYPLPYAGRSKATKTFSVPRPLGPAPLPFLSTLPSRLPPRH